MAKYKPNISRLYPQRQVPRPSMWDLANQQRKTKRSGSASNFLSNFTNPIAAYSLVDLNGTSQNVVRVRRSSDNAESDFTAIEVDDGTLETFVGGVNNGFVTKMYNQVSGGVDLAQTTTADQPQIVSAGSLIRVDSIPTIQNGTSDDLISANFAAALTHPISAFAVYQATSATSSFIFSGNISTSLAFGYIVGSGMSVYAGTNQYGTSSTSLVKERASIFYDTTSSDCWINGTQTHSNVNPGTYGLESIRLGAFNNGASNFRGYIPLLVICDGDERANRTAIESAIDETFFFELNPASDSLTEESIVFENGVNIA